MSRPARLTSNQFVAPLSSTSGQEKNPNYLAIISCNDKNITVTASLPEEFSFNLGATYEEAFSQGLTGLLNGGGAISSLASKSMKMLGLQLTTKALTAKIWQGSTSISFSLPLVFQVETDSEEDLQSPLRSLYTLVLPNEPTAGGLLEAPGPRVSLEKLKRIGGDVATIDVSSSATGVMSSIKTALSGPKDLVNLAGEVKSGANGALAPFSKAFMSAIENNISLSIGTRIFFDSVVITSVDQQFAVQPLDDGVFQRVHCTVGFETFYVLTQNDMENLFSKGSGVRHTQLTTGDFARSDRGSFEDEPYSPTTTTGDFSRSDRQFDVNFSNSFSEDT